MIYSDEPDSRKLETWSRKETLQTIRGAKTGSGLMPIPDEPDDTPDPHFIDDSDRMVAARNLSKSVGGAKSGSGLMRRPVQSGLWIVNPEVYIPMNTIQPWREQSEIYLYIGNCMIL